MTKINLYYKSVLATVLAVFPAATLAQQTYTLLEGSLPNINQTTTLETYIPSMFTLIIAVGAAMAFVVITYGGILYATTDNLGNKQEGRKYIENAVYGLIILIGSYAILNTINPQLVRFDLNIRTPVVGIPETPPVTGSAPGPGTCTTCVTASSIPSDPPIPTRDNATMYMSRQLGERLATVSEAMGGYPWQVNEALTTAQGVHVTNSCHNSGTCADVVPVNRQDPGAINTLFGTGLSRAGFSSVTFEVTEPLDSANIQRLRTGCNTCTPPVPPLNPAIRLRYNDDATGWHFHVIQ